MDTKVSCYLHDYPLMGCDVELAPIVQVSGETNVGIGGG